MKEFSCADMGYACQTVLTAQTEDRLAELVSLHLREVHGMTSITQDMVATIKNLFASPASPDAAAVVDGIFEKYNCTGDPACTWRYIAEAEMILTGHKTVHSNELKAA